nr:hypothetical protein [Salmonella enterica]
MEAVAGAAAQREVCLPAGLACIN